MRSRSISWWSRVLGLLALAAAATIAVLPNTPAASADQLPQSITFTSTPPAIAYVSSPDYVLSATTSAGLPVGFSVDGSESVCSIAAYTDVYFTGVGTCTIDANNYGNAAYLAAPQVQQIFNVEAAQSVTFASIPPTHPVVGSTYALDATASSGLPVTFSIDPGSATTCSVSGSVVSFIQIGTCLLFGSVSGNDTYGPANNWQSFPVYGEPQTVTFTSNAPLDAVVGGPSYSVTAVASSGLPVTFAIYGPPQTVCYLSGSAVILYGPGTCSVDAIQSGTGIYAYAGTEQSFSVSAATEAPAITSADSLTTTVGVPLDFQMTATGIPAPTFSESGKLPTGVSFSTSGLLDGTPVTSAHGTYPLIITATNGVGTPAQQIFTLVLDTSSSLQVSTSSLTSGVRGARYLATLATAGGNPPYRWSVVSGALPSGLRLNKVTGIISGRPKRTDNGVSTFTVEVADKRVRTKGHPATQNTATEVLSITIS